MYKLLFLLLSVTNLFAAIKIENNLLHNIQGRVELECSPSINNPEIFSILPKSKHLLHIPKNTASICLVFSSTDDPIISVESITNYNDCTITIYNDGNMNLSTTTQCN